MEHYRTAVHRRRLGRPQRRRHTNADRSVERGALGNVSRRGGRSPMSTAPSPRQSALSQPSRRRRSKSAIALIDRIIAAYERREDELAQLIAQEVGRARLVQGAGDQFCRTHESRPRRAPHLRLRAAAGRHDRSARAHRRLRADLAVELADADIRHQGDLRHRSRLHDGAEAIGRLAGLRRGVGRGDGRGGNAARRLQPDHRSRQRRGRGAVAPPRRGLRFRSPDRPRRASVSARRRPRPSSASAWNWAASRRTSS